jgi:hypothetical protein
MAEARIEALSSRSFSRFGVGTERKVTVLAAGIIASASAVFRDRICAVESKFAKLSGYCQKSKYYAAGSWFEELSPQTL